MDHFRPRVHPRKSLPFSIETIPTFSIVIPVYNGGAVFKACLKSVAAAIRPGDEIIVVADGESDSAYRIAPSFGATVIKLEKNGGPARARNIGAKSAKGDIIFFVDADCTVRPDALKLIEATFARESDVSALIGSYDDTPYHTTFVSQYKNLLHHFVHQHGSTEASTFWGACGAIKRDVFLAVGGFTESYTRASIEDIELGYRLTSANYRIRLLKELQITHMKRWEAVGLIKTEVLLRGEPWTKLLWKQMWHRGQVAADLNLDAKHRYSLINSAALVALMIGGLWFPWLLLGLVPSIGCFLYLNSPVLKFFYQKRGLKFMLGAALWRYIYDLYCWVGFLYGSSGSVTGAARRLINLTITGLDRVALGVAVGAVASLGLTTATVILLLKSGDRVGHTMNVLGQFLPGYSVSWLGALLGLLDAFVYGYAFGWAFAVIRNYSLRMLLGREKFSRAIKRIIESRAGQANVTTPPMPNR